MKKITEGKYAGKFELVEQFTVTSEGYAKKDRLSEKESVLEVKNKKGETKEYKCEGVYTFPISRPNKENLNERIYSDKLWEKVIKEKQAEDTYGLIDHPDDEGSFKDAFCVWRNIRFSGDKKLVMADSYLFGDLGRKVKEALDAGGKVGLSTVGYGDFKEDDRTIDESTYELDRVADFVLNPSYEVFGTKEDQIKESNEEKNESKNSSTPLKEKKVILMKKRESIQTLEEKNFRLNVQNLMREAEKKETPADKLSAYADILEYFDDDLATDLREAIEKKVEELDSQIKELALKGAKYSDLEENLSTASKEKASLSEEAVKLKEENEKLNEKIEAISELADSLKVYANKAKEMYEFQKAKAAGMVTASQYNEFVVAYEELEKEASTLRKEILALRKQVKKVMPRKKEDWDDSMTSNEAPVENDDYDVVYLNNDDDMGMDDTSMMDEDGDPDEPVTQNFMDTDEPVDGDIAYNNVKPEIADYYEDLEIRNPKVIKIKEDILRARTLMEAQMTYMRLKSLVDKNTAPRVTTRHKTKKVESIRKQTNTENDLKIPEGWL